jgi:hypothetical protein
MRTWGQSAAGTPNSLEGLDPGLLQAGDIPVQVGVLITFLERPRSNFR